MPGDLLPRPQKYIQHFCGEENIKYTYIYGRPDEEVEFLVTIHNRVKTIIRKFFAFCMLNEHLVQCLKEHFEVG